MKLEQHMPNVVEKSFFSVESESSIDEIFDIKGIDPEFDLIGIKLKALNDKAAFVGGEYLGLFETTRDVRIGITVCTFKREQYLLPNLERLNQLIDRNPNYNIMVIDNGQTLKEVDGDSLQIIHNPNFGGAGGFTRGLIEQVNQNKNTHVLLMDDDIVIELSSFDRLYSIVRHLKTENTEKFFGGAMIRLDEPTIQYENTACWDKRGILPFGTGFNLKYKNMLCENEHIRNHENHYAAWWFCCIPLEVVHKIGYPIPIFIRGDDMEYSIRNDKGIMNMNGIGVWHETFEKKFNLPIFYFHERNMFIISHLSKGTSRFTFLRLCAGIIFRRILNRDGNTLRTLELALKDLNTGLNGITSIGSDEKFTSVRNYPFTKPLCRSVFRVIPSLIILSLIHFFNYDKFDKELKNFRETKLKDQTFWRQFLRLDDKI